MEGLMKWLGLFIYVFMLKGEGGEEREGERGRESGGALGDSKSPQRGHPISSEAPQRPIRTPAQTTASPERPGRAASTNWQSPELSYVPTKLSHPLLGRATMRL